MAKIADVPNVIRQMGAKTFARKLWNEIQQDAVFTWGSSLAYSWIFSLFPFLLFLLTLVPYIPGAAKQDAMEQMEPAIRQSVSSDVADQLVANIHDIMQNAKGGLLSFSLVLALWGASGGMSMTMSAIDKAYEVKSERSFLKHRLVAMGITICVVGMILVVLIILPIGGVVLKYFSDKGALGTLATVLITIVRYVLAIGLLLGSVSLIYYWGPNIKQKYHTVTPGAILTVALWIIGGLGFGFYVSNFGSFNETYGTLGAAIILLLFFYIAAIVLLIGAELNSVLDFAVLGVKPGSRDFTGASTALKPGQEDASEKPGQRKDAIKGAESEEDQALQKIKDDAFSGRPAAPIPVGKAQAGWWKWAAVATVVGFAVGGKKKRFG